MDQTGLQPKIIVKCRWAALFMNEIRGEEKMPTKEVADSMIMNLQVQGEIQTAIVDERFVQP